ncbi:MULTISPECIES: RidA family protein [Asticcacaulis]|uniref:RidA family protein n=1 Tax=Asticcacaulis TaxID=76890 RepID=UPI001AE8C46F|nr:MULTISPECIES: RidA family protein [Asticcacaulis]MBP2158197.1 enamine deaminase RidA (YjgF/YER057c/UK114 family) [Asticcacaulis solisilvae]MDR6799242.1 enamine deaminase RidA (YjgF/YER057c/UK114 family) [Asticcacaulis sp. BE141]
MKTVGLGVALSLVLTGPALAQIEREYVNPWEKEIGYAQVVRHGDTLYLSGITANGATLSDQMTAIYGQIGKILKGRGLDSTAIVSETIYTRDMEALKAAIPVRKSFYKDGQFPASSWVQVERLFNPDLLLEIEVRVALKP